MARITEPTSKQDSLRVLEEAGIDPPSYPTVNRRLPAYAESEWRASLAAACAAHARLGPASLVLYDVSTLYFETGAGGFPLMVEAFESNKAETHTMLPVTQAFMTAHRLADVTIVADAGMISETNKQAIEQAGLSFILGMKIPEVPYVVQQWRREHPDTPIPDGRIFIQPWPAAAGPSRRDQTIYYQYRADRARRTLRGIDEQVAKAERAVAGRSSATGSSGSTAHSGASTGTWRPRPGNWPGSRTTSPTCRAPRPSS